VAHQRRRRLLCNRTTAREAGQRASEHRTIPAVPGARQALHRRGGSERLWERFCQVLGITETIGRDPRFATNADRLRHRDEVVSSWRASSQRKMPTTGSTGSRRLDIPAGPINEVDEALTDPHVLARGMVVEWSTRTAGHVRSLGTPAPPQRYASRLSASPAHAGAAYDRDSGTLGYSQAQIEQLEEQGVV